jgi:hypothetical protein
MSKDGDPYRLKPLFEHHIRGVRGVVKVTVVWNPEEGRYCLLALVQNDGVSAALPKSFRGVTVLSEITPLTEA